MAKFLVALAMMFLVLMNIRSWTYDFSFQDLCREGSMHYKVINV